MNFALRKTSAVRHAQTCRHTLKGEKMRALRRRYEQAFIKRNMSEVNTKGSNSGFANVLYAGQDQLNVFYSKH